MTGNAESIRVRIPSRAASIEDSTGRAAGEGRRLIRGRLVGLGIGIGRRE